MHFFSTLRPVSTAVHLQTFVAEERDEETPAPTEKRTQLRFDV